MVSRTPKQAPERGARRRDNAVVVRSAESPSGWSVYLDDRLERALDSHEGDDLEERFSGEVVIVGPEELVREFGADTAGREAPSPTEQSERTVSVGDLAAAISAALSVSEGGERAAPQKISLLLEEGAVVIRIDESDRDAIQVLDLEDR